MARFRLKEKHYINIAGSEWEYKEEVDTKIRGRRRPTRKVFPVPQYLDPADPTDQNYEGEIIISTVESNRFPNDYVVSEGFQPTFDMEPIDADAEDMMEAYRARHKGEHPIESLSGTYGEQLLEKLSRQLEALGGHEPSAPPVSLADFNKLKSENEELRAKIDEILARLPPSQPKGERRI